MNSPARAGAERGAAARCGARWQPQQPPRPFLLEIQRPGRRRGDPSEPAAQFGHIRPDAGFGQDFEAEGQRGGADVVSLLDPQCLRDRRQVVVAETAVTAGEAGGAGPG
jgi:hypothetical protein